MGPLSTRGGERRYGVSLGSSKVPGRPSMGENRTGPRVGHPVGVVPVCGGDPAADSPTATLLRLKPPCEAQIRPLLQGPHPDLTRVL